MNLQQFTLFVAWLAFGAFNTYINKHSSDSLIIQAISYFLVLIAMAGMLAVLLLKG